MTDDPVTIILTGPPHSGKTTVCERVIESAQRSGLTVAGIITMNSVRAKGVAFQHVVDLRTGRRSLLATATAERTRFAARHRDADRTLDIDDFVASWEFDKGGVADGNAALVAAASTPCDILLVDQLGPLEFFRGGGFTAVFDAVLRGRHDAALVVVSPFALEPAKQRFAGHLRVMRVSPDTRDALPAAIMELCRRP